MGIVKKIKYLLYLINCKPKNRHRTQVFAVTLEINTNVIYQWIDCGMFKISKKGLTFWNVSEVDIVDYLTNSVQIY